MVVCCVPWRQRHARSLAPAILPRACKMRCVTRVVKQPRTRERLLCERSPVTGCELRLSFDESPFFVIRSVANANEIPFQFSTPS